MTLLCSEVLYIPFLIAPFSIITSHACCKLAKYQFIFNYTQSYTRFPPLMFFQHGFWGFQVDVHFLTRNFTHVDFNYGSVFPERHKNVQEQVYINFELTPRNFLVICKRRSEGNCLTSPEILVVEAQMRHSYSIRPLQHLEKMITVAYNHVYQSLWCCHLSMPFGKTLAEGLDVGTITSGR
jgi:hypothetical protein